MTLAQEHPLTLELSKGTPQEKEVREFVERIKKQDKIKRTSDDYEKEGMFIGAYCRNPLTGGKMPIFAGNFVLLEYGTGAVMAVPTHDQRDFYFAKKFGKMWPQYRVVFLAGYACGQGLVGMLGLGFVFMSKSVFQAAY